MDEARTGLAALSNAVRVTNRNGRSPFVILCDHASNHLPAGFGTLGLEASDLARHIAWDPGALPVATALAAALDAPLVASRVSRLVIDCNRAHDAPDLIADISETTVIPANRGLLAAQREERIALAWRPFHDAIAELVDERLAAGLSVMLVSVHSFNPVYRGVARPWHVGIIHDGDMRLAGPVIDALCEDDTIVVGDNQPYSPADRVFFTLERHGRSRGLACAMIEIRNDEIAGEAGQRKWADMFTTIFRSIIMREGAGRRSDMRDKGKPAQRST